MVQFNLLPNVKLEYVRTRRTKYLLTLISIVVSVAAIVVLLFSLFMVNVIQKKSLNDLNKDISTYSQQLQEVPDLSKILTVQNQLSTLTQLHDSKPVTSRLFDYISKVTPAQASLNKITIDFSDNSMNIGGSAPTLDTVSLFTDTLKVTEYTIEGDTNPAKAFSSVVLSNFGRDDKGATFTITMNFDLQIFNAANKINLVVPSTAAADSSNVFGTGA